MFIVHNRKIFYGIAIFLTIVSLGALFLWGLNLSIDFKGGTLIEVEYGVAHPAHSALSEALTPLSLGVVSVRPTGENGFIVRTKALSQEEHTNVLSILSSLGEGMKETRFNSLGPVLGTEAVRKSLYSILFVLLCIVLFITFAFRHVSEPVASWKYGLATIIALFHDLLIPTGAFAFFGHFFGYEIDTLFVTALLVVLGFSVHDSIVVFDRVRENLKVNKENRVEKNFEEVVGESISQTFARSINTSLTTLLSLVVLYFLGGEATRHFALALIIGIAAGTYSSIFLGSPLLVTLEKLQNKSS